MAPRERVPPTEAELAAIDADIAYVARYMGPSTETRVGRVVNEHAPRLLAAIRAERARADLWEARYRKRHGQTIEALDIGDGFADERDAAIARAASFEDVARTLRQERDAAVARSERLEGRLKRHGLDLSAARSAVRDSRELAAVREQERDAALAELEAMRADLAALLEAAKAYRIAEADANARWAGVLSTAAVRHFVAAALAFAEKHEAVSSVPAMTPALHGALRAWCRWYSARLTRIGEQHGRGEKPAEDYTGYEQDLFEACGCNAEGPLAAGAQR